MAEQSKVASGEGSTDQTSATVPGVPKPRLGQYSTLVEKFNIATAMHGITDLNCFMVMAAEAKKTMTELGGSTMEDDEGHILMRELLDGAPWDMAKSEELAPLLVPFIKVQSELYEDNRDFKVTPEGLLCLAQTLRDGALDRNLITDDNDRAFFFHWCILYEEKPSNQPEDLAKIIKEAYSQSLIKKEPTFAPDLEAAFKRKFNHWPIYNILKALVDQKTRQLKVMKRWEKAIKQDVASWELTEEVSSRVEPLFKSLIDFTVDMLQNDSTMYREFVHELAIHGYDDQQDEGKGDEKKEKE